MRFNKIARKEKVSRNPVSGAPIMRTRPKRKPISKSPPPRKLNISKRPVKAVSSAPVGRTFAPQTTRSSTCTWEEIDAFMTSGYHPNWRNLPPYAGKTQQEIIDICKQTTLYHPEGLPQLPDIARPTWIKGIPNWLTVVGALGLITGIVLIFRKKKK